MPVPYDKQKPANRYTLEEAARYRNLVQHECVNCQRRVIFLPLDLIELFGPDADAYARHWACSTCGAIDHVRVTLRTPQTEDVARLTVRRLDRIKQVPVWRDEVMEFDTTRPVAQRRPSKGG
jgi:hypothetical protein